MTRKIDPDKRKVLPPRRGKARAIAKAAEAVKKAELPPYYLPGNPEGQPPTRDDDLACEILQFMANLPTVPYRTDKAVIGYRYGKTRAEMLHTWSILVERRKFAGTFFQKHGRIDPDQGNDEYAQQAEIRIKQEQALREVQRKADWAANRAEEAKQRERWAKMAETRWIPYAIDDQGALPPVPHAGQVIVVREQDGNVRTHASADDYDWTLAPGEPGTVAAWKPFE